MFFDDGDSLNYLIKGKIPIEIPIEKNGKFSMLLLLFVDFFKINFFKEFFQEHTQVSDNLDPDQDILLVLIWVQTICKGYQQPTKVTAIKKRVYLNLNLCKTCVETCVKPVLNNLSQKDQKSVFKTNYH